jgi:hypothetical protein
MLLASDVSLARRLERGELPDHGFHHADHLRVAWVYLEETGGADAALAHMATTLRRIAAAVGTPDKYSHGLTAFWVYQLAAARAMHPGVDFDALLRACPRLLDKNLALAG